MLAKRLLSVSAAALLAIGVLPASAFAADTEAKTVRVVVENTTLSKANGAAWEGTLIDTTTALKDDSDMQSVVEDVLKAQNIEYSLNSWGGFAAVNGLGADKGSYMSTLDDWFTAAGSSSYTAANGQLYDGAEIKVVFSEGYNYGYDIGSMWDDNTTTLTALKFSDGELDKAFASDATEYTLTLSGVTDITVTPTAYNKNFQVRTYKNSYEPESTADYKRTETVDVVDGDKLIIGVGDPAWPSMNSGQTVTKYTVNIKSDITSDSKADAEAAEKLIDEIGEVTLEKADAVNAAQTAYSRLNDAAKKLVGNADVLDAAIKKLAELKAAKTKATFDDMFASTAERLSKEEATIGNEWKVIGLARADKLSDEAKASFKTSLEKYVSEAESNKLKERYSTENSKDSIAAAAIAVDPAKVSGKDILTPVTDKDFVSIQGITGQIWANTALTGLGKEGAYTSELLAAQLESGAFSYDGKTEDVDITAMTITALAKDPSAKDAIAKALDWLATKKGEDGSFGNCESTAQVIIALTSAGVDIVSDERFADLIEGLSVYYLGGGEFSHLKGGAYDGMSTEQAFLALTSYYRFANSKTALYDFSDVTFKEDTAPEQPQQNDNNPQTGAAAGTVVILLAGAALIAGKRK
ncbi:MAG: hypothetical protein IJ555_05340 [Ruminococcus sp.]|nr:hypothetical protein [Ruminococcus sp.]